MLFYSNPLPATHRRALQVQLLQPLEQRAQQPRVLIAKGPCLVQAELARLAQPQQCRAAVLARHEPGCSKKWFAQAGMAAKSVQIMCITMLQMLQSSLGMSLAAAKSCSCRRHGRKLSAAVVLQRCWQLLQSWPGMRPAAAGGAARQLRRQRSTRENQWFDELSRLRGLHQVQAA